MQSSKRKFQALLNGLGARPISSLPKEGGNNDSQMELVGRKELDPKAKRPRTGHSGSISAVTLNKTSKFARNSNGDMPHRKAASVATGTLSTSEQNAPVPMKDSVPLYNPYDREAFLARLKTFSKLLQWSPKPDRVEANEWAKRGWVCKGNERVRCDYCFVEIVVKVNVREVDGIEQQVYVVSDIEDCLVNKYADMIATAHAEACPWRKRGCGDSIFHLNLNNAPITLEALRNRYDTLCAQRDKLPYMHNMHLREDYKLNEILSYLPDDFFAISTDSSLIDPNPVINQVAIFMALCGWHGDPNYNSSYGSTSCSSCFRNLGLWLFKSKKVDENGDPIDLATMEYLDPIAEHRDYCPWKSGKSQSGPRNEKMHDLPLLAAWQVTIRVLKNNHYLSKSVSGEAFSRISMTATTSGLGIEPAGDPSDAADEKVRDERDKQRQGRLSKIKSLFDIKGGSKAQRNSAVEAKEAPI